MGWSESFDCFDGTFSFTRVFGRSTAEKLVKKQVHLIISGMVQGVFFRASASGIARSLKLNGFIRNLSNGNVEVCVEGEEEALKKMLEWCRKGPPGARVEHVEIQRSESADRFEGFQVR